MRLLFVALLMLSLVSCSDKMIQLPQIGGAVLTEVVDHSPVYFFFETKDGDTLVDVNRNNLIGTTNWIFNIDKRLPLKKVMPELAYFFKKKKGKSMHKNDKAEMYFSYSDSINKQLAFEPFTSVIYSEKLYHSSSYIKKYPEFHMGFHNISITIGKKDSIWIDGELVTPSEIQEYLNDFVAFASEGRPVLVYLNFDQEMSFDRYMKSRVLIRSTLSETMQLSFSEFIYDAKEVFKDCNCIY